jgi:hypothetical protein
LLRKAALQLNGSHFDRLMIQNKLKPKTIAVNGYSQSSGAVRQPECCP